MLDQVLRAGTVFEHRGLEFPGGVQLVVAGEQVRLELPLVVLLAHEVAAKDFEPTVPLPDFLPQVRGAVPRGIHWVASRTLVSLVERQERG